MILKPSSVITISSPKSPSCGTNLHILSTSCLISSQHLILPLSCLPVTGCFSNSIIPSFVRACPCLYTPVSRSTYAAMLLYSSSIISSFASSFSRALFTLLLESSCSLSMLPFEILKYALPISGISPSSLNAIILRTSGYSSIEPEKSSTGATYSLRSDTSLKALISSKISLSLKAVPPATNISPSALIATDFLPPAEASITICFSLISSSTSSLPVLALSASRGIM